MGEGSLSPSLSGRWILRFYPIRRAINQTTLPTNQAKTPTSELVISNSFYIFSFEHNLQPIQGV